MLAANGWAARQCSPTQRTNSSNAFSALASIPVGWFFHMSVTR
jgi:hypothetical protein